MVAPIRNSALVLLVCLGGCNAERESTSQTNSGSGAAHSDALQTNAPQTDGAATNIEPGFYRDGADYERVAGVLAKSDASVRLDFHSGIEWYDKTQETWSTLENINDVRSLLASTQNKHLVTVATGKAMWDKYDDYIAKIAEFADELGFDMTIVTDDNAQGLIVSKVIQHKTEIAR